MNANYKGTILGLQPIKSTGANTVYAKVEGRCDFWNATIFAEYRNSVIKLQFVWENQKLDILLIDQGKGNYSGRIFLDGDFEDDYGTVSVKMLNSGNEIMLIGDYSEDVNGLYSCFIELRPMG